MFGKNKTLFGHPERVDYRRSLTHSRGAIHPVRRLQGFENSVYHFSSSESVEARRLQTSGLHAVINGMSAKDSTNAQRFDSSVYSRERCLTSGKVHG